MSEQVQAISKGGGVFPARVAPSEGHHFWQVPVRVQFYIFAGKFRRFFRTVPRVIQLPFGSWWLAYGNALDESLLTGKFEPAETEFLMRYLHSGMTVLDVGAHHGYYALLASRSIGASGKVIAFEPSPKERVRLRQHLQLNGCSNVSVESFALEEVEEEKELFLVDGTEDYCNSLRPPVVNAGTTTIKVKTTTLDKFLRRKVIDRVDFIKMDVEGAELNVLKGAQELFTKTPRPVLLVELYDMRTAPWGYAAREVVQLLAKLGYRWYEIHLNGSVASVETDRDVYDANLVAIPPEREEDVLIRVNAERV